MKNSTLFQLGICALAVYIIWFYALSKPDGKLHVALLDIGQGDSIYIKTPHGEDALIDGGPNDAVIRELGHVMAPGDREISLLVATHPDADHIGGLISVLERYSVREIWINGAIHTSDTYLRLLKAIDDEKKSGATVKVVTRGDRTSWGAVTLLVLTPFESFEGKKPNEQNKGTIVARLSYNNFSVLLTGDCEFELEDRLMAHTSDIYPLTSTILKVGHHGSAGSTSEKFLQAVDPKIAVISVGAKNRYGHPTKRVLDLLEQYKIPFYRTDEKARIEIESDGDDYQCVAC